MRRKSKKLAKLERERFSVFTEDLSHCSYCGGTYQLTKHEIFEGRNRQNSMKYGFVLPLCLECHRKIQDDLEFSDKWKRKSQEYFEKNIGTKEEFIKKFGRNYLL